METLAAVFDLTIFLRVFSAVLLGFAIGLEREMTNKYAGLRTNILVCLGACVFTIISIYGFPTVVSGENATGIRDTARVAAQVVTGIGFIGGGTVLRHGASVFGLTTAATLWVSASIGMACGAGLYGLAIMSTVLSIVVLISVRMFETDVLRTGTKNCRKIRVNLCVENEASEKVYNFIVEHYPQLTEISKKFKKQDDTLTKITVVLDVKGKKPIEGLYKDFQKVEGIDSLSITECID